MQNSILPFTFALSDAPRASRFVAIYAPASDGEQFLGITPKVMEWDKDTFLLDLLPVLHYWSHFAEQQGIALSEYLSSILSEMVDRNQPTNLHQQTPPQTSITLSNNPWQALLLLSVAMTRPSLRIVDAQSHGGVRLFHDISWENWLTRCRELREHFILNAGKKPPRDQAGSLSSLTKTISRLQYTHIFQMRDVDSLAMLKRFGKLAALAWEWTWLQSTPTSTFISPPKSLFKDHDHLSSDDSQATAHKLFSDQFPWQSIRSQETPQISRIIDHHLRGWDHIEPLLREDLDKLCNLTCWSTNERVVSLEWQLSFSCSPSLRIPILFRHPHALHRESGHHKTALLQAFHSWQRALRVQSTSSPTEQIYLADEDIVEWQIVIRERMPFIGEIHSLFHDDAASDLSQLRDLENLLPVPLVAYSPTDHWSPEMSFERESYSTKTVPFESIAKLALHQRRPLFIYETPQRLHDQHHSSGLIFCERVGTSWWSRPLNDNSVQACRNYYIRMTDDGLLQWVYQTDDGATKLHGIYG